MSSPVPGGTSNNSVAASRRTRSVGTKLTADEYARLESFATQRGLTPGEWVREIVLAAFEKPQPEATPTEQALLSEVLALRTILINTVYDLASGEGMTPERMEKLIAKADAGKLDKALERLKETTAPRSGGSNPR
jgi:hypothetical protein